MEKYFSEKRGNEKVPSPHLVKVNPKIGFNKSTADSSMQNNHAQIKPSPKKRPINDHKPPCSNVKKFKIDDNKESAVISLDDS